MAKPAAGRRLESLASPGNLLRGPLAQCSPAVLAPRLARQVQQKGIKGSFPRAEAFPRIPANQPRRGDLSSRALKYASAQSFWMNYQQIKAEAADVFIFIGVWADEILYWVLSRKEIQSNKYLSHQHRGGIEFQIGNTDKNIRHFDAYQARPSDTGGLVIQKASAGIPRPFGASCCPLSLVMIKRCRNSVRTLLCSGLKPPLPVDFGLRSPGGPCQRRANGDPSRLRGPSETPVPYPCGPTSPMQIEEPVPNRNGPVVAMEVIALSVGLLLRHTREPFQR